MKLNGKVLNECAFPGFTGNYSGELRYLGKRSLLIGVGKGFAFRLTAPIRTTRQSSGVRFPLRFEHPELSGTSSSTIGSGEGHSD